MIDFKLRIRKIILETLLNEGEFGEEQEKSACRDALFAFMEGKVKVTAVEDTEAQDLDDAMSSNDYSHQGHTYISEEPIIAFTFNHKDFSVSATIEKEYFYRTEDSSRDFPGHEDIKLKNIKITSPHILVYDEFGTEFIFTPSEIGSANIKHLEKIFTNYIK